MPKLTLLFVALALALSACDSDSTDAPVVGVVFDPALLTGSNVIGAATLVDCTLTDGTETRCYEVSFGANPVEDGPYCPQTIDEVGGVGFYDGATNPGFQALKAELWDAMEADGYDIVDADGNVNVADPGAPGGVSPACLEATPDDGLVLTFTIPAVPTPLSTPDAIGTVEFIGLSLDGIPIAGVPPSVVGMGAGDPRGGNIPAIGGCGGHIDPRGYLHWHLGPEEANNVLDANGITDVRCTAVPQSTTALIGFAKDGYPIYASQDAAGMPSDLDACGGHTSTTADYADEVYHYHVSSTDAPNVPSCVVGASVRQPFQFQ
ncbi:MAG: YHYH protein [Rhodothermales bacterium]